MIEAGTGQGPDGVDAYIAAGTGQHGNTGSNAQLTLHRILAGAGIAATDTAALVHAVAAVTDTVCTVQELNPGPEHRNLQGYEDEREQRSVLRPRTWTGAPSGSPAR
ncbi:hypothetical protein BIV57_00375 [Mangrovactinospora gilvigrisea]|uniref:Uncharacterized protein n=1 Tax=Mangrovactinospora gilvigrisea TaxID=1428644 RepID=A0A1J7C0U2_9ACTN|nr:hypothetical protein [Mangrovactinospora gilvigrisea]OIV39337.1 hypothetical protein BIV57_00375 [Mangrovactinospora gilvigrisea]